MFLDMKIIIIRLCTIVVFTDARRQNKEEKQLMAALDVNMPTAPRVGEIISLGAFPVGEGVVTHVEWISARYFTPRGKPNILKPIVRVSDVGCLEFASVDYPPLSHLPTLANAETLFKKKLDEGTKDGIRARVIEAIERPDMAMGFALIGL
jgi:hypothetical protein